MDSRNLLIVEDDTDIRENLTELLEGEGYTVEAVENGKVALELLARGFKPCVILLDLMMPVMSGWTFLKIYREKQICTAPVIVISAAVDMASAKDLSDAILPKPLDIRQLLFLADKYCNQKSHP